MRAALLLVAVLGTGCICGSLDSAYADLERRAGVEPDAGADAGKPDAGPGSDAGPANDAGPPDAGPPPPDGGPPDGGPPPDAGLPDGGCQGAGGPCSAGNPAVCCAMLCCASDNATQTLYQCGDQTTPPLGYTCIN